MDNPVLFLGSVGITFCIGLISGLYPAFYLPAFPAISALKGRFKMSNQIAFFEKHSLQLSLPFQFLWWSVRCLCGIN